MEERNVTKKFFDNYRFDPSLGAESTRFYNDSEYIKIIHKNYLKDDREKIIKELYHFNHNDIVKPLFSLKEKGKFIGYGMQFLDKYKDLEYYLDNITTFDDRKELMIRISKIFDYFEQNKFAYYDIHAGNIMYKDGDIKLIDLDGGVLYPYVNYSLDYNAALRVSKKNLARFALSTICDFSQYDLLDLKKVKKYVFYKSFYNSLPRDLQELYEFAINNNYSVIPDITNRLNNITQTISEDTREIIEKKLRLY